MCNSLALILFSALFRTCFSANWAQPSGKKKTDNIIPPSYFTKRFGHALVVIDSGKDGSDYVQETFDDPTLSRRSVDRMYMLGGDDYNVNGGGGGYKNDIWVTSGADWAVVNDLTIVQRTSDQKRRQKEYDESLYRATLAEPTFIDQYKTKTISKTVWTRLKDDLTPSDTGDYYEMIACPIEKFQGSDRPFFHRCNYQKDEVAGAVWWSKRWSPRRNHAAVAFRAAGDSLTRMWVLGGRARLYEDYPDGWHRVHGGYNDIKPCDCDYWFLPSERFNKEGKVVMDSQEEHPLDDRGFPITEFCVSIQTYGAGFRNCFLRDDSEELGVKQLGYPQNGCDETRSIRDFSKGIGRRCSYIKMWHEPTVLMNDVWVSPPEDNTALAMGEDWKLVNPGCMVRYYPYALPNAEQSWKNGSRWAKCGSDADCNGDSFCDTSINSCVCNMWTPREDHAVAVFKNRMYVTGGYVWLERHTCGDHACGGEYRVAVNDVWWTADGRTWSTLNFGTLGSRNPRTMWVPRAGHLLLVPQYTATEAFPRFMWVVGGKSTSLEDSTTDTYYNDVWRSTDGKNWRKAMDKADWAPRTGLFGAYLDDIMVIGGGHDANKLFDDVWTWDRSDSSTTTDRWIRDFANETKPFRDYVRKDSPVSVIPFVNKKNQERLLSLIPPVTDLEGLADITSPQVLELQDIKRLNYPDICLHMSWAAAILDKCTAKIESKDDVGWNGILQKLGEEKLNVTSSDRKKVKYLDYCSERNPEWTGLWSEFILLNPAEPDPFPYTCRWQIGPTSHAASIVYQNRLWIVGGIHDLNGNVTSADVWYRDAKIPRAGFKTKPSSGTWEGLFEFKCDEQYSEWCRYEYRVFKGTGDEPLHVWRDWFANNGTLDFGSSWWWPMQGPNGFLPESGMYTLQVRAVDPAGNKDIDFIEGVNQHTWEHFAEPPWPIIFTLAFLFVAGVTTGIAYWQYLERKRALQRYAMKRMRRKFKRMQKIKAGQLHKQRKDRAKESLKETVIRDEEKRQEKMDSEVENARDKRRKRRGGRS